MRDGHLSVCQTRCSPRLGDPSHSHLQPGLSSGLSPPGFPMKTVYAPLLCPTCATSPNHLICLDMTISIIPSEEDNHEVPLYALAPSLLLHCPSQAQTLSSGPYSHTPSAFVLPSVWQPKFHAQTKQQSKLYRAFHNVLRDYKHL